MAPHVTPAPASPDPLTVVVHRRIKPGCEAEFDAAMHAFVDFARRFPGYCGLTVLRPDAPNAIHTVVARFRDVGARREFTASATYADWMRHVATLTLGDPRIDELVGLEGWFSLPSASPLAAPPAHKMALATYAGVVPVTIALEYFLAPWLQDLPYLLRNALFNAGVVTLLTWVVMPLITRGLRRWLFPG